MQAQNAPVPPTPPTAAQAPVAATPVPLAAPTAAEMYEAVRAMRSELRSQQARLESTRRSISSRLRDSRLSDTDRSGLEQRLTSVDQQLASLDKQVAAADASVAQAAAVPGAVVPPAPPVRNGPPDAVFAMGALFILAVLLPLSIGWARRLWRRGAAAVTALPEELGIRLTRLEQATDAIAIEVERVAEGQRFVTRLLSESPALHALGAGQAQPIGIKAREAAEVRR